MGQCAGKARHKGKQGESRGKDIPPNSPLGEMLENWEKEGKTKELDKVKMVQFCVEEWPREVIQEGPVHWPWYGSKEKWLCKALNKYVNTRQSPNDEEIRYAASWLNEGSRGEGATVYKVVNKEAKEEEKIPRREWDPPDYLPPSPPPAPLVIPPPPAPPAAPPP